MQWYLARMIVELYFLCYTFNILRALHCLKDLQNAQCRQSVALLVRISETLGHAALECLEPVNYIPRRSVLFFQFCITYSVSGTLL